jgi:hypothetical protein
MLNETLYRRLCALYGQGGVLVVNEDIEQEAIYRRAADEEWTGTGLVLDDVIDSGEEYRVDCPLCSDTAKKLYINHTWGVRDNQTGSFNRWSLQCFHCHFEHDYAAREQVREEIYGKMILNSPIRLNRGSGKKRRLGPMTLPGPHWNLADILRKNPDHEAIQYLQSRQYNIQKLGEKFDVGFCPDSAKVFARQRIVAPVLLGGKLVSWTARYLGTPPDKTIPKWAHAGGSIGAFIYNFDDMIRHKTIVLVEGPGDVWSFGKQAGGLFGKIIRRPQIKLLKDNAVEGVTIVILLDPEKAKDDVERGREHHIERTFQALNSEREFHGRVLPVYLPEPFDPGDLDSWYMRDYIKWKAKQADIPVDFSVKARVKCRTTKPKLSRSQKSVIGTP